MNRPLIFVSYSHRDEAEKDRLLSHIRAALQSGLNNLWSDDLIGAGADWEREIATAIGAAKVAILLITADFLNSDFILQKEVKTLLERREKEGLHVFPVIAKACAWNRVEWLRKMNVRPKNGRPIWGDGGTHVDEDLAIIADEVADIIDREIKSSTTAGGRGPLPPGKTPPPETKDEEEKTSQSPKVLIVDDKPRFRRSVIFNLKNMDITFYEADSVAQGIKILDSRDVQVILLDLDLNGGGDGVAILEHIKDRASNYRVIIITAHTERLVAERAADYNVFSYLPKTGEDVSVEMLRFAVTRCLSDLKWQSPVKDQEFSEEALKRYPPSFIYIYQYLKSYIPAYEALVRQKDMFELLMHFSAVVLLSEYLYGAARSEELDAQIRSRIYKPSLGDWFNIINEIVKRRNDFSQTFFLDSFLTFYTGRNKKTIGELIGVRNKYVGHGPKPSDYETESLVKRGDQLLTSLLRDYQFITHFLMCYPLSVQKLRTGYLYNLRECTGENPQLLSYQRNFSFLMDANEMHLINLDTKQYQSLHPFIILEICDTCRQLEIFFYSKFSNNQLHYLSYTTGHWIVKEESATDFLQLIKADE